MSDFDISVHFDLDADGFLSQECPSCTKLFKAKFTDEGGAGSGPLAYCPYCGHHGTGCWWTAEQARYLEQSLAAPLQEEFRKQMGDFKQKNRGGPVRWDVEMRGGNAHAQKPNESDDPMPIHVSACHDEPVKHDGRKAELHCIICGETQSVST